jgi:cyclopropane fatty-acyl-phospholipid synthase-like methyltransferase
MNAGKTDSKRTGGDLDEVRRWFDEHAADFKDVATVEHAFLWMSPEEQRRLNWFKLWHLHQGTELSLAGKRVLEFGAGHGRMAIEFSGYESYVGVDFSPNLVRIGEERLRRAGLRDRAQLVVADCFAYDGPVEAFDVVCSLGMFAYVDAEDAEAVLRKMCLHLKPGGTLFIDGHHASPLYDSIRRRRRAGRTGGSIALFGARDVERMFARVGLTGTRVIMREYPLLGELYARRNWAWALRLRNELAKVRWLNVFATNFIAIATKPDSRSTAAAGP